MPTCITPGNEQNVVTEMRYGFGGQLVALIAKNPVTGDQVTRYEYGVTLAESGVASNDLLRAEIYPDAVDSSDRVRYSYNRQGQRTRMQDQNGSVHEYEYDRLGRQTADKVTTLGDGVDGAVRRIGRSYEVRGLVEKVTSYSDAAGTTPVNEVQNTYNSFAQLKEQYQEHSGAVDTDTTPKVQYAYADGSANTIRQTSMTYPNGRVLDYLYDDTHADKLSRIRTLRWDDTEVCRYSYLGLSTFVTTDYLQPQVKLDYALGSGANPYAGFDRFGQIIDLLWAKYGASSSSSLFSSGGPGNDLVHLNYGYDRASNRTYREDLVAQSYDKNFDELYEYDGLHRLKKFHRGRLVDSNTAIESPTLQQGWVLDATGNWQNFTQNDQADADQTLDQQRLHNRVNEITQVARTVGQQWATPEYDRNGNMTVIPQPKEMTKTFQGTWDAWNGLVKIEAGISTIAEYLYDGLRRRTTKSVSSNIRHIYYSSSWQALEERLDLSTEAEREFVWGLRYIDNLILRDRGSDANESLDERLYALQDSNWNVVAIMRTDAAVQERFAYHAYGMISFLLPSFQTSGSSTNDWETLYAGVHFDANTGLMLNRARYYTFALGRFLSRDLIHCGTNSYVYAACTPCMAVDPSGLWPAIIPTSGNPCPMGCDCKLDKAVVTPCQRGDNLIPITPSGVKTDAAAIPTFFKALENSVKFKWHLQVQLEDFGCCELDLAIEIGFYRCTRQDGPFHPAENPEWGLVSCPGRGLPGRGDPWNYATVGGLWVEEKNVICEKPRPDRSYYEFCPLVFGIREHALDNCYFRRSTEFYEDPTQVVSPNQIIGDLCNLMTRLPVKEPFDLKDCPKN